MRRFVTAAMLCALSLVASPSQALDKVVIAQPSEGFLYLPMYVARAKGYMKDEGIELDVQIFKGGAPAMTAVIAGDADIYTGVPSTPLKAFGKGQNVQIWASVMQQVGSNFVLQGEVAKRLGLTEQTPMEQRLRSLKGLTIGINGPGSSLDQVLRYMLRNAGLSPDRDVTITPLGADGGVVLGAFSQKRIDGFLWSSPTSDIAIQKYSATMLVNFAKGEYGPLDKLLYVSFNSRADWLAKNPDLATRLVRALWRGKDLMRDHSDEARESVRSFFANMDQDLFNLAWEMNRPAFIEPPNVRRADVERALQFIKDTEGEAPVIDIDKAFTDSVVQQAAMRR